MADNNGYISEWVPGPDGGMMHVYNDPYLDGPGDTVSGNSFPPEDEPTSCDFGEHDWVEAFDGECSYCRSCGAYDC